MKKKIITFLLIALMLFGGVFSLTAEPLVATVTLNASVGEIPANTGIRVVEGEGVPGVLDGSSFDPVFFSAPSAVTLATGVDTAANTASGKFTVLVRRPTVSGFTVNIEGTGLKLNGENTYLAYTLKDGSTPFLNFVKRTDVPRPETGFGAEVFTNSYSGTASTSSILRHQKTFTYNVPRDTSGVLGTYTATWTFTLTTN